MASFSIQDVSKGYGPKKLFENVNVAFSAGRRYGLTGPNGAGKTTFMKILAADEEQDSGEIMRPRKLGVLRQDHFKFEGTRVLDVVIMGNKGLWAALEEKHHLLEKADLTDADGHRLADLEGVIAEEDGYSAESDAAALLGGLGIEESFHEGPLSALTGGYKLRVLLAQALFGKPEGLLLDEPTNNLDLDSIRWLETFLHEYEGVLITISHDRHFLNSICTHIADIDYEAIILYPGGYDDMVRQKSQVRSRVESETVEKQKKISQLNDFISRFSAGTRASQVQSRKNQLDKLKVEDVKRAEGPQLQADPRGEGPDQVVRRRPRHSPVRRAHHPRREDLRHRKKRRGQVDAGEARRRGPGSRRRHHHLGPQRDGRVHAAGSPRHHQEGHHRLPVPEGSGLEAVQRGDLRAPRAHALLG